MDKIDTTQYTKEEIVEMVKKEAENLYDDGTFFCSEAVVTVINSHMHLKLLKWQVDFL